MEGTGLTVVVDANLIAALILPLPYSEQATTLLVAWKRSGTSLLAPLLLEYEVSAVLRRAVVGGLLDAETADRAMNEVLELHIHCLPPSPELHHRAMWWAAQLGHSKTYDAQYLALAERMRTELWTADRRLVDAAHRAGAGWVRDASA